MSLVTVLHKWDLKIQKLAPFHDAVLETQSLNEELICCFKFWLEIFHYLKTIYNFSIIPKTKVNKLIYFISHIENIQLIQIIEQFYKKNENKSKQ
jgi:hypothetical protein